MPHMVMSGFYRNGSYSVFDIATVTGCRWWPGEVVLPNAIPDNLLPKKAGQCMFVVKFCGSNDYCWTYHGRTLPYTLEEDVGEATVKKRKGWSPKKCRHSSDSVFQKGTV